MPESATFSARWRHLGEGVRTDIGIAYAAPGRLLSTLLSGSVPIDFGARHLVSVFVGTTRILDPGAVSAALQWIVGLPSRECGILRYEPGRFVGTVLVTEALHPGLVVSFGVRRQMELAVVAWPELPARAPTIDDALFVAVQTGPEKLRFRAVGTISFAADIPAFSLSFEVEHNASI